jgi:hypothetical protein
LLSLDGSDVSAHDDDASAERDDAKSYNSVDAAHAAGARALRRYVLFRIIVPT